MRWILDNLWKILNRWTSELGEWADTLTGNRRATLHRAYPTEKDLTDAFDPAYLTDQVLAAAGRRDTGNTVNRGHRETAMLQALQNDYARRHFMNRNKAFAAGAVSYVTAGDLLLMHEAECNPFDVVQSSDNMLARSYAIIKLENE